MVDVTPVTARSWLTGILWIMGTAMATSTQISIRRVLYLTDFSPEAAQAVPYVHELHRCYGATVAVVHVLDVFPLSLSSDPTDTARIAQMREEGRAQVQAFMLASGFRGGEFKPVVLTGEVSHAVDHFAHEQGMDLIVLGSHGKVGVRRLFEGSMAEEIFRTAESPVMVVGPNVKTPRGSFNNLFFPTDLGAISKGALPYIDFMLRENGQAKVSLAHFVEQDPGTPYERHKMRRFVERDLTALLDPALRPRIEEVVTEFSAPAEGMISLARGLGADLLFLGVRQGGSWTRASTHGLWSITHQVISQSPCPVFTVRGR